MMQSKKNMPLKVGVWMVGIAWVVAFLSGAGLGTIFNGIAVYLGALWVGFGWQAVIVGFVMLGWGVFASWRGRSTELNG